MVDAFAEILSISNPLLVLNAVLLSPTPSLAQVDLFAHNAQLVSTLTPTLNVNPVAVRSQVVQSVIMPHLAQPVIWDLFLLMDNVVAPVVWLNLMESARFAVL